MAESPIQIEPGPSIASLLADSRLASIIRGEKVTRPPDLRASILSDPRLIPLIKGTKPQQAEPRAGKPAEYAPTDELVKDFKKVAFETRAHDLWSQIERSAPQGTDPIRELIRARAQEGGVGLSDNEIAFLAERYHILQKTAGLDPSDRDLNHWALINFFLGREGIIGKKPARPASWGRKVHRLAAAGMAALVMGGVGKDVLPGVAEGLLTPPVLSAQTISENEQIPQQTTSATLTTEKPTFFIPGTDTPAQVDLVSKDLQVLRPAGDGRFLVETDSGVFEVPFNNVQLEGDIGWSKERQPLSWLGFDASQPELIDKMAQTGVGLVRIAVNQADQEFWQGNPQVIEAINKAKEHNLKIIVTFNPAKLLANDEISKRLDNILSLMGDYQKFSLELGNEADLKKFWQDGDQETFAKFIMRASVILKERGVKEKMMINAPLQTPIIPYFIHKLKQQGIDPSQFVYTLHAFHDPKAIKERADALKKAVGQDVKFILTETGSNDPDPKVRGERTRKLIEEARKDGALEVVVFQFGDFLIADPTDPGGWGYAGIDENGEAYLLTSQIGPLLEYIWQEGQPASPVTAEIPPVPQPASQKETTVVREEFVKSTLAPAFNQQALEIRRQRAEADPEYYKRVDRKLNENRINILLLGMGGEIDQPTDTIMVLSYSMEDGKIQLISIPRDLHAREIDEFLEPGNKETSYYAINTAYSAGGYPLIRQIVENATALSVDATLRLELDGFIKLVGQTLGDVEIDIKEDFNDELANIHLKKGRQKINPEKLLLYLRARQSTSVYARNERQQEILEFLAKSLAEKLNNGNLFERVIQIGKLIMSSATLLASKELDSDTDLGPMLKLLKEIATGLPAAKLAGKDIYFTAPPINKFGFDLGNFVTYAPKEAGRIRPHTVVVKGADNKATNIEGRWYPFRRAVRDLLLGPGT